jgi:DNA-binding winged helix-turn-helix (wHTH) protein
MNSSQFSSLSQNPFSRPAFWGRHNELRTIYKRLLSEPPQCCAIISETSFGKTTLLRNISESQRETIRDNLGIEYEFTFAYLDCISYIELAEMGAYASAKFWWDMYNTLWTKLQIDKRPSLPEPQLSVDHHALIDTAFEIKSELEGLIRTLQCPVIFVLDNFEGIARLPPRDSEWLRAMARLQCAYVVSSRHLLYLLYQYNRESWASPSPLWNLFSDPIYLGLMKEEEAMDFIFQAGKLENLWKQEDIKFIRRVAGRHPEIIRIACSHLFEQRLHSFSLKTEDYEFLEFSVYRDASAICNKLWHGLADPELNDEPTIPAYTRESPITSPYQKGLIDIAKGCNTTEKKILFVLEQRGLIERVNGEWHVFAEVMRQFALQQEQDHKQSELNISNQTVTPGDIGVPAFAYLEGRVYEYLKSHVGEVCDREDIKRAVWGNNPPTNSALQKIIERIREKIEPDPENPRYLIAVRGQGFMLREDPLEV